jgi:hypothetical protein
MKQATRLRLVRTLGLVIGLLVLALLWPPVRRPAFAQATPGTIAYVRGNDASGDEIWLIQPDGSSNRRIWSVGQPDPDGIFEISDLDWRPDAGALAFSSNHEFACSLYASDIYTIWPDGGGYQRLTNRPACGELAGYPKGGVTVTVRNYTTRGPFFVYVQGAPGVRMVVVPAGGASTVTFPDVADFGDTVQVAVVIEGPYRWIAPIAAADVKPGQTVHAGTINVTGAGIEQYGAYFPSWHLDGSRVGYSLSAGADMWQIPAAPQPGDIGSQLLKVGNVFPNVIDFGPTPATANQILYYSYLNGGIYRVTEGSSAAGAQLVATEGYELVYDVQWLPDGSGFLFTKKSFDDNFVDSANVFVYTFAAGSASALTDFSGEFARDVSASPDGQFIVFERSATQDFSAVDLWVMRRDGTDMRRLVQNGRLPSWSRRAPQVPQKIYLSLVRR